MKKSCSVIVVFSLVALATRPLSIISFSNISHLDDDIGASYSFLRVMLLYVIVNIQQ